MINKNMFLLTLILLPCCKAIINSISIEGADQILVTDVSHDIFMKIISPLLNTSYLQRFNGSHSTIYHGIIWGSGLRAFVVLPVRLNHKRCPIQINVIFKVDTGSPISTLTQEALHKLFEDCPKIEETFSDFYAVRIAGRKISVSLSRSYYENLNILGANFIRQVNGRLQVNYSMDLRQSLRLEFDVNVLPDNQQEL